MINFAEEVLEQIKLRDEKDENYEPEELEDKLNEIMDRLDSYMELNLQLSM
mgnify:FL=1